jgi:hypothetical protein
MNKTQLIEKANQKNFRVEFSLDQFGEEMIGINKNKSCYHWFNVFSNGDVMFNHTYSMNTGTTKKGTMHGLRVYMSLDK